nr:hypothetical protein [Pedobacter panaciterrae]
MEASEDIKFNVTLHSNEQKEINVEVKHAETTDGIPYYICKVDGKEAQIRKDEKWEQIWGSLTHKQVDELGSAISKHLGEL